MTGGGGSGLPRVQKQKQGSCLLSRMQMRSKCKLHLGRRVRLPGRSKKWEIPVLKLKHASQAQFVSQEECGPDREVVEVSAFKKISVDFFITIGKLQSRAGRQPVGHPTLA